MQYGRLRAGDATVFVEPVGDHPRAVAAAAQFALQVVEVAVADAAQEPPDRDAARAGLLRDLVGRLEPEPIEVREHVARDARGGRRQLGIAGFDGTGKRAGHRLLDRCRRVIECHTSNKAKIIRAIG